jgi:hypothetical protein
MKLFFDWFGIDFTRRRKGREGKVVSNVYQIKSVPLDLQDLIAVIVAVLLPFVPVLLYEIPLNVILPDLMKLLL